MDRKERRAIARAEDKQWKKDCKVAPPIDSAPDTKERASVRAATTSHLVADPTLTGVEREAALVHQTHDRMLQAAFRESGKTPARSSGCAYCCHFYVAASAPEVIRAVAHARRTLDADTLTRVQERAISNAKAVRGKTLNTYPLRLPCAFLEKNECVVYEARPIRCRSCHSLQVDACRAGFEAPTRAAAQQHRTPIVGPALMRTGQVEIGFGEGLTHAKRDAATYELQQAVAIALEAPDAGERWLAGEPVFAPARIPDR